MVSDLMVGRGEGQEGVVTVRVGHAAGVASSSVRFEPASKGAKERGRPVSVVMMRTAREIMRGEVLVDLKEGDGAET